MLKITVLMIVIGVPVAVAIAEEAPRAPAVVNPHATHHHSRRSKNIVRPSLPAHTQPTQTGTSTPAPVPNEAVTAPIDNTAQQTKVAPSVFSLHYPNQGDGYVTGSSPQAMDDRNAARATGVQMSVPLPQ